MKKAVAKWLLLALAFVMGAAVAVGVSALAISGGVHAVNGVAFLAQQGESVSVHIGSESDFYLTPGGKHEQGRGYYTDSSGNRHAAKLSGDLRPGQTVDVRVAVVSSVRPPLFLIDNFRIFQNWNGAVASIFIGLVLVVIAFVIGFYAYAFGTGLVDNGRGGR